MRCLALALLALSSPALAQSRFEKLSTLVAEGMADQGFWKVSAGPLKATQFPDGGTITAKGRFMSRLTAVDLASVQCDALFPKGVTQLTIAVHGIGGAGDEWEPALGPLTANNTQLVMYRWFPSGSREGMSRSLADGINSLQECLAGNARRIVVFGHSAGGVLAATAASMLRPDSPEVSERIAIVTVAAPLGGMGMKQRPGGFAALLSGRSDAGERRIGRGWMAFIEELGSDLRHYLPAPPGVHVLHLRTHPGTDIYATNSSPLGHDAGWVVPGVPGARAIDLDSSIDHSGAVAWAARELQKDSFKLWQLDLPVAPPPANTGQPR